MDKVKEVLLEDFKKANKERKVKLAAKYGLTVEEYFIWLKDEDIPDTTKVVEDTTKSIPTDIVIAFDTTGSMDIYISDVKKHVTSLIPELFKNTTDLRIGVVAFGDYCDMTNRCRFGDAYQVLDLTNNQDSIISFVKNAKSTSGGDADEFYELVIKKIQEETSWREGSNKSILLIGDCNPHKVGYTYRDRCINNQIDWRVEATKCKDLGIKIDTLSIRGAQFYEDLANITGGICIPFKSSQKTSQMMEGYTYTRTMSTAAFTATLDKVMASGDDELIATYNVFSKTISEL